MSSRYWRVGYHFFPFLPSFPTGCCSFLLLSSTVGLKFYSVPTFRTSLSILCESGIIIVQSYPSSLIRPPLLEKCFLHFPSRFYTPTDGCMNLTTVRWNCFCLFAASTLWNVNLFSSYYILEVIKVSTSLPSLSLFLHSSLSSPVAPLLFFIEIDERATLGECNAVIFLITA